MRHKNLIQKKWSIKSIIFHFTSNPDIRDLRGKKVNFQFIKYLPLNVIFIKCKLISNEHQNRVMSLINQQYVCIEIYKMAVVLKNADSPMKVTGQIEMQKDLTKNI